MDDIGSEGTDQETGDAGADTCGIDCDGLAAPDVFEEIDELGKELAVLAAGPPVKVDDLEVGLGNAEGGFPGDLGDGDRGGVALGMEGSEDGIFGFFGFAGEIDSGDEDGGGDSG